MTEMSPAEAVFFAAAALSPSERDAYLSRACNGNDNLRQRVEQMLAVRPIVGDFLEPMRAGAGDGTQTHTPNGRLETVDYADPTARVGSILAGKYKLIEEIGEGGMGSVYMAQQTEPVKRAVAVKVIKAGMDSKAVLARFEAERQALAMMDHPNIAKVLDAGTTDGGRPFFVMELVKGVPITQYCDERKLTPRQRLELFVPVCQAIQHAHQKGIIHRDIKPSNVLVAMFDDRPVPKVIDFGVAKAAGQALTDKTLMTGFGAVVGTPEYMSPEQANLNNLDIDTRSDVYSLGVLLYELLTGSTPVDRKSLAKAAILEILRIVREVEAPKPSHRLSTAEGLPGVAANRGTEPAKLSKLMKGELDWLLMKALEKDRARRYDTANAFSRDIQRYLADEMVEARPPSTGYRLKKFVRRNKGRVIAASLVLLALLAGLGGTVWGLIEAKRQEQIARDETTEKEKARLAEAERVKERDKALAQEAERVKERDKALEKADEAIKSESDRVKERDHQLGINEFLFALAAYENRDVKLALERLDKVPPSQRGWEWSFLKRQTQGVFTIHGHTSPVMSVCFSPDGARIASGSHDGTVKVWDARIGIHLLNLNGHEPGPKWIGGGVMSVSFSPDGARIATGGSDGKVKVSDTRTGKPLLDLQTNTGVYCVKFSPDGRQLVAGTATEVKVWDAHNGTPLPGLKIGARTVTYSPDGTRIVTGGGRQLSAPGEVKVWNAHTGELLFDLKGHSNLVTSVSYSLDGTRIATGSVGGKLLVWDAITGTLQHSLTGHSQSVMSVCFSPDGTRIASGSGGGEITSEPGGEAKVWDVHYSFNRNSGTRMSKGTTLLDLKGHTESVNCVSFSPDGASVATGSSDHTVKLWNAHAGTYQLELRHTTSVASASFSPDGARIVTGSRDNTAKVWDARTGLRLLDLVGHTGSAISFSGEQAQLVNGGVACASFSPGGARIATGSFDNTAKVWDARNGSLLVDLKGHSGNVTSVSFSLDGARIVTGSRDNTAKVWDAQSGVSLLDLKGHTGAVTSVCFSSDGKRIVTGSFDNTAKVWDAHTGAPLLDLKGHTHWVESVSFSPNGARIVTGSVDQTAKVWDARTGGGLLDLKGHRDRVASVCFSPNGTRIVTGGGDPNQPGELKVWDARTGMPLFDLKGHTRGIRCVSFSPDGMRIVTGSHDGTAKVWDARIGRELNGDPKLDAEEIDYRLVQTRPNGQYYREAYATMRITNDRFAEMFYLDRILSLPENRTTTVGFLERNKSWPDPLAIARTGFHHPALATTSYDRSAIALLAVNGNRLAQRLAAQQLMRNGKPGAAIPLLLWCMASRPADSPPVEELLVAMAYTNLKQPDEAKRYYRAAAEWLDRPKHLNDGPGFAAEPGEVQRRNPLDWEAWYECSLFRAQLRLPAVLRGEEKPADDIERIGCAELAFFQKKFAGAARLWAEALASSLEYADDRRNQDRYNAACAAALAAAGQGQDEPPLDDAAKGRLRRQALDWLRSELTAWENFFQYRPFPDRAVVAKLLSHWRQDPDLAGIRDSTALTKLPLEEQKAFTQLWADVTALLNRILTPQDLAARGDWSAAAASYARGVAVQAHPNGELWFEYTAVLLLSGDREGYRKICAQMLEHGGESEVRPYHVARACTLAAHTVKEAALSGQKAEGELKRHGRDYWSLTEQGALAYRAGRYDEAATLLEQSLRADSRPWPAVVNWLWLSLVEHRRGKAAEARAWLEKATQLLEQYPTGIPVEANDSTGLHLHNWLEAQVLRREAEALHLSKK